MNDLKKTIVIGAGGHARVVCDILLQNKDYEIAGLIAPHTQEGFFGLKVLGDDSILPSLYQRGITNAMVALGTNALRQKVTVQLSKISYNIITVISQYAIVSPFASVGQGTVIMPGAVINARTTIGEGCIINTNCSIDHDCIIGNFSHIAPGATLCGTVTVGSGCFICAGARIIDKLTIGQNVILGAGAAAIHNIESNHTAVGVPARIIK